MWKSLHDEARGPDQNEVASGVGGTLTPQVRLAGPCLLFDTCSEPERTGPNTGSVGPWKVEIIANLTICIPGIS